MRWQNFFVACLPVSGMVLLSISQSYGQNVGIGTNNPTHRLHVAGTGRFDNILEIIRPADAGCCNAAVFNMHNPGTNRYWHVVVRSAEADKLQIWRNDGTGNPWLHVMTFQMDGHVGIGTNVPWAALAVERGVGNTGIGIHRPGISAGGLAAGLQGISAMHLFGNRWSPTTGEAIRFGWAPWNGDWNDFTEVMRIHTTGDVGIGTAAPTERLHIQGNLRLQGAFMPNNNPGTAGQVLVSQGAGVPPVWQPLNVAAGCPGAVQNRLTKFAGSGVCNTTLTEDNDGHIWNVDGSAAQPGIPTNAGFQYYVPAVTRGKFSITAPGWNSNRIHGIVSRAGYMQNLLGGDFRGIGVVGLTQNVSVEYGFDAPARFYYDPYGAGGAFFSTYYGLIAMATGISVGGNPWGGGIIGVGGGASQRAVAQSAGVLGVGHLRGVIGVGERNATWDASVGVVGVSHQGVNTSGWSHSHPNAGAGGAFGGPYFGVFAQCGNTNNINSAAGFFTNTQPQWREVYVAQQDYATNTFYKIRGAGAVSTIVWDPTGIQQHTFFAPEAPEVLFMDRGVARLQNGRAVIRFDELFAHNIAVDEDHPLTVYIQLEDDCRGVYVTNKSREGFEVRELNGGTSDARFSWIAMARRADERDPSTGTVVSRYQDLRAPVFTPTPVLETEVSREGVKVWEITRGSRKLIREESSPTSKSSEPSQPQPKD